MAPPILLDSDCCGRSYANEGSFYVRKSRFSIRPVLSAGVLRMTVAFWEGTKCTLKVPAFREVASARPLSETTTTEAFFPSTPPLISLCVDLCTKTNPKMIQFTRSCFPQRKRESQKWRRTVSLAEDLENLE